MSLQLAKDRPRNSMAQLDVPVFHSDGDDFAVGRQSDGVDGDLEIAQGAQLLGWGQVPDPQRPVVAGRNGALAIGGDEYTRDSTVVSRLRIQQRAGGCVPQASRLVVAARRQDLAIRGKSDANHAV